MDLWGEQLMEGISNEQLALLFLIQVWDLIWKSLALWKAARSKDIFWFVLLIVVNSAGLLPAFYLFYVSKTPPKKLIHLKMPVSHKADDGKKEETDPPKKKAKK